MRITKYVHATFELKIGDTKILIDPGKYNFGGGRFQLDYLTRKYFSNVDIVLLSHIHADHYDSKTILDIYERCAPNIISSEEVGQELADKNIRHSTLKPGEKTSVGHLSIEATSCDHVVPCIGFLISDGNQSIYYVADSLYYNPKLEADVLLVPIGNRGLVMNPYEAAEFTKGVGPKLVIPMHYESPKDEVSPTEFKESLEQVDCRTPVRILQFKETVSF